MLQAAKHKKGKKEKERKITIWCRYRRTPQQGRNSNCQKTTGHPNISLDKTMLTHTKKKGEEMFSNRNGSFFFSLLKWLNMHCLTGVCKLQAAEQYQIKHVWIQRNQQLRSPYPSYNEIYHGHHFLLVTLHERILSLSKKKKKKKKTFKKKKSLHEAL